MRRWGCSSLTLPCPTLRGRFGQVHNEQTTYPSGTAVARVSCRRLERKRPYDPGRRRGLEVKMSRARYTPLALPQEFEAGLDKRPADWDLRSVIADWLEDNGDVRGAKCVR